MQRGSGNPLYAPGEFSGNLGRKPDTKIKRKIPQSAIFDFMDELATTIVIVKYGEHFFKGMIKSEFTGTLPFCPVLRTPRA
jgi:hypothetical protein